MLKLLLSCMKNYFNVYTARRENYARSPWSCKVVNKKAKLLCFPSSSALSWTQLDLCVAWDAFKSEVLSTGCLQQINCSSSSVFFQCTHDPVEGTQVDVHNARQTLCPLCRASFLIDSRESGDCVRWDYFMKFMITILLFCANELTAGWIYKRITAKITIDVFVVAVRAGQSNCNIHAI